MSIKKQTKNTQQIAKTHESPGTNSLSSTIAYEFFLLSVGISVVAIFVNQLSTRSEVPKTLINITLS